MMQLISQELNGQLNNLIGKAFAINRMMDRGISLISVRWKLKNTAAAIHEPVAHIYSTYFADNISDYQGIRGMESIYPATPDGNREYNSPVDFFSDLLSENIEFEDMIKDSIELAISDGDYTTELFLKELLSKLKHYTELSSTLVDLFETCGESKLKNITLDANITKLM